MFPAQATTYVIQLFPWHLRLCEAKASAHKQTPYIPLTLSFSLYCIHKRAPKSLWAGQIESQ